MLQVLSTERTPARTRPLGSVIPLPFTADPIRENLAPFVSQDMIGSQCRRLHRRRTGPRVAK